MGSPNTAQLHYVEVMCESIIQGMYCVLVVVIFWLLMQSHAMPRIHKILFVAGIVMWILSSVHLGLVIQQVTQVVTPVPNAQAQASIAGIQFMIGDTIIIWRVWAVWGRSYLMTIIPFLLLLASAAVRFTLAAEIVTFAPIPHIVDVASALLVTNVLLSTVLIAGRIWYMQWQMSRLMNRSIFTKSHNKYKGVFMLIIESGAIYALSQMLGLILDDLHNQGVHTVYDIQIPLAGLLPTLIVLVVHFDLVPGPALTETYQAAVTSQFQAAPGQGTVSSSVIGGTGSNRTAVSLKMETINDAGEHQYKRGLSNNNLPFDNMGDV